MGGRLTDDERQAVLAYAREVVAAAAARGPSPAVPARAVFTRCAGAFVTLHHGGRLRGCIGYIDHDLALGEVIRRYGAAAAVKDPRFEPVSDAEVDGLELEVSVLSGIEPVNDVATIVVGRDGLIVEQGWHRGLLLPQVATEQQWDRLTFLEQTCRKAGLPTDAWQHGAKLFRFQAEVFAEPRR